MAEETKEVVVRRRVQTPVCAVLAAGGVRVARGVEVGLEVGDVVAAARAGL